MALNQMTLDTKGLEKLIRKIEFYGGNVDKEVEKALAKGAERIQMDTHIAMNAQYLPAQGKYWTGMTAESIVDDVSVRWDGLVAWIPVGFDFSLPGAGGYLITGTPRMAPNPMLRRIYKTKGYLREIQKQVGDDLNDRCVALFWGEKA